jgi:hypothetical protein
MKFWKCAMHDERALCTGEAEWMDSLSHGTGDSEPVVPARRMRELSGVYG